MAEVTKPIMLDETGQELIDKINELKNVLTPTGTLNVAENGTYDVSEKASAVVDVINHTLVVTAEAGSTVTATKDDVTIFAIEETSGTFTALLPMLGTWSVTATKGTKSKTITANVMATSKTIVYATTLEEMELGSTVYLDESATEGSTHYVAYNVVEKRNDCVVLLRASGFGYHRPASLFYTNDALDNYLTNTFVNNFKSEISDLFVESDVECMVESTSPYESTYELSTILRKAFVPSSYEFNGTPSRGGFNEGNTIWNGYFTAATGEQWWIRTWFNTDWKQASYVTESGELMGNAAMLSKYRQIRPAIFVSNYAIVDTEDGNKIKVS